MTDQADRAKDQKARFDAAHAEGMAGFKAGDLDAVDRAIKSERGIIEEVELDLAAQKARLPEP